MSAGGVCVCVCGVEREDSGVRGCFYNPVCVCVCVVHVEETL